MNEVRLSPLDTAWLFTESRATPNHVGGLLQFRLPADAPKDFLRQLMSDFPWPPHFCRAVEPAAEVRFQQEPGARLGRGQRD
jgi:hypothetical protein